VGFGASCHGWGVQGPGSVVVLALIAVLKRNSITVLPTGNFSKHDNELILLLLHGYTVDGIYSIIQYLILLIHLPNGKLVKG
jgi:hypothetical protein